MSLRVLWVSHFLPYPPKGGVLQRGFGLVSGIARSCDLHLLAMHQPRLFEQVGWKGREGMQAAVERLKGVCSEVEVSEIPSETRSAGRAMAAARAMFTNRSYTETWLSSSGMSRAVTRAVNRIDPDVVHFDTVSLAPYIDECPGSRVVSLGHHNVESHMMWRRAGNSANCALRYALREEAYRILRLERMYAPRVDINVVCSILDEKRLRRLTHVDNSFVAENGVLDSEVDPAAFLNTSQFSASSRRLVFVGRMSAYTNRDAAEVLVRDIWPRVSEDNPDLSLDVIGSGAPAVACDLARMDARVRVHGFVDDLSGVLLPGSIFVCPVRDGGGTKLKILDAMNRGLPIVAHPAAVEGIDVKDGEHVLVATTPEDFAFAIERLFLPEERIRLAQNAYRLVRERYSFGEIARKLYMRFEELAKSSKS